jgi:C-3',4' desaturase CrtD
MPEFKWDPKVVVIGAGLGGLTTAAVLVRAGMDVTVLEAQVYPGGCASTFLHQGFRFEAGATLAGGFHPGGPMDRVKEATGIAAWHGRPTDLPMCVHLPDGTEIPCWGDERRWDARQEAFGAESEDFWRWQERTADAFWRLALRLPPWPPQSPAEYAGLINHGLAWYSQDLSGKVQPGWLADAFRPVAARLKGASGRLRMFVDAQLLISAQVESSAANALYGAAALDLPRRGVVHLPGGIGSLALQLVEAIRRQGSQVIYRQAASRIVVERGRPVAVETARGETFPADLVIANLTPWSVRELLGEKAPERLKRLAPDPNGGWGAFVVYAGMDGRAVPEDFPLHHQIVAGRPLGEGNSVFLSLSPAWDGSRAPEGKRALTLSTHTALEPWWALHDHDLQAYEKRKAAYTEKVLAVAGRALPGLREAASLVLPGTPVTFRRFTRRSRGWVGGFPQTSLLSAWGPRLAPGLWLAGDSVFPGQSTAAVALGGLRIARAILNEMEVEIEHEDRYRRQWNGRGDHGLCPADAGSRPRDRPV